MTRSPLSLPADPERLPLLTTERGLGNPFARLQARDATLELGGLPPAVADLLRRLHAQYAKVTLLTSPRGLSDGSVFSDSSVKRRMRRSLFYVLDGAGTQLMEADPAGRTLRYLGGHDREILRYTTKTSLLNGEPGLRCDAALAALVDCPPGGFVLATAAGTGPENALLHAHVRERNGSLLCHDIVPYPALCTESPVRPPIPYAALPPHPSFLVPLLEAHPGPKTVVARNLLSVCSPQGIADVLEAAGRGGAERVIFSQTSTFAPGSPILPAVLRPEGDAFRKALRLRLESYGMSGEEYAGAKGLITAQARRTLDLLCWEAVRRTLVSVGGEQGFLHYSSALALRQETLQGEDLRATLSRFQEPRPWAGIAAGGNALGHGFGGVRMGREPGIAPETVVRTFAEWVCVLGRSPVALPDRQALGADALHVHADRDALVPVSWRLEEGSSEGQGGGQGDDVVRRWVADATHEIAFTACANLPDACILRAESHLSGADFGAFARETRRLYANPPPPEDDWAFGCRTDGDTGDH